MKRKPFITTGALFMGLIVLLGVIGLVNGLWSKNLVINGSVETGDLNADWDCGYTNDDGQQLVIQGGGCTGENAQTEPAGDDGSDPSGSFDFPYSDPFVPKDVADCTLAIGDSDPNTPPTVFGDQVATVTITNAYPSYECAITMLLSNTGSIPFNISGSNLNIDEGVPLETLETCEFETAQVDPGEEEPLTCTVHVLQTAEQNVCTATTDDEGDFPVVEDVVCTAPTDQELVSYSFNIEVCVAQWNEDPSDSTTNPDDTDFDVCKASDQHEGPEPEVGVQGVGICDDGIDNDVDGDTDADDSGCLPDTDGDGTPDVDDTEVGVIGDGDCDDGLDNDGDGDIDGDDSGCVAAP